MSFMKMIKCVQCGKDGLQKTKKIRKFCSRKCGYNFFYHKDPDRFHSYWKKYYDSKREWHIKRSLKWLKNNPEKAREQNNKATRKYKEKTRYDYQRLVLLKKYDGKCQECGSTHRLQVHHKDRVSYHNSPVPNNNLENLELLCQTCHLKGHHARGFRKKRKSDTLSN